VHQHLNIGQGEVDWDVFFGTLHEVRFDGIMTACACREEKWRSPAMPEINATSTSIGMRAGNRRHEGEHSMTVNVGIIMSV
jgi:myo-inositol catabolism protein IolH